MIAGTLLSTGAHWLLRYISEDSHTIGKQHYMVAGTQLSTGARWPYASLASWPHHASLCTIMHHARNETQHRCTLAFELHIGGLTHHCQATFYGRRNATQHRCILASCQPGNFASSCIIMHLANLASCQERNSAQCIMRTN